MLNVDPNRVYVICHDAGCSLAKKVIQVPDDIEVGHPEVPLVTRVEPGKSYSETLSLRLPLEPLEPYVHFPPGDTTIEAEFRWEIGYFHEKPGTLDLARTVTTNMGKALRFSWHDASKQSILKSGPFPFRVPLRVAKRRERP
jgi:hypothetical protein